MYLSFLEYNKYIFYITCRVLGYVHHPPCGTDHQQYLSRVLSLGLLFQVASRCTHVVFILLNC